MNADGFAITFAVCAVFLIMLLSWASQRANEKEAQRRRLAAQEEAQERVEQARRRVEEAQQRLHEAQLKVAQSRANVIRLTSESPAALEFLGQFVSARSVAYLAATSRNWTEEMGYDYKAVLDIYCEFELLAKTKRYGEERYILTGKGALLVVTFSTNETLKKAAAKRL